MHDSPGLGSTKRPCGLREDQIRDRHETPVIKKETFFTPPVSNQRRESAGTSVCDKGARRCGLGASGAVSVRSGRNVGAKSLRICTARALLNLYEAACWPGTNAVTVPNRRSPMMKTNVAVRLTARSATVAPPGANTLNRLSPVPVFPATGTTPPLGSINACQARRPVPFFTTPSISSYTNRAISGESKA